VVLDKGLLGLTDSLFDGVKLLGNVKTRTPAFDHLDDAAKVPFGPAQTFDDLGM
jgi:hypothetical protein